MEQFLIGWTPLGILTVTATNPAAAIPLTTTGYRKIALKIYNNSGAVAYATIEGGTAQSAILIPDGGWVQLACSPTNLPGLFAAAPGDLEVVVMGSGEGELETVEIG